MIGHDDESLERTEAAADGDSPRPPFRWRWGHTVFAIVCVIAIAAIIASLISIPYYAITPGTAQSVEQLIGVPASHGHEHEGQVLLVDVELIPLRAIEWPWFALQSNDQIVGSGALLGSESAAQYQTEGEIDMSDAQQAATVVALNRLGYKVKVSLGGALLYALQPDSPASQSLAVGEVVTSVDGHKVNSAVALGTQLRRYLPGETVSMGVFAYPAGKTRQVSVRLSEWRLQIVGKGKNAEANLVCAPYGTDLKYPIDHISPDTGKKVTAAPCIGALDVETNYVVGKLPFRIDLSSEGIIGPSAGLAFTLGLMQRLDPYDLTGGLKVAATGTMSIYGQIGDVGGVAQKTIAVRAAGAKIFFVPPQEYKVALAHSGNGLKIYAVSTIGQVLKILERYGGRLPTSNK
ncbi:MAG: S16 family serine protease [Acidimicrobiales bacterium]